MTTDLAVDRLAGLEAKLDRLTEQVALLAENARAEAARREVVSELVSDLSPIALDAMGTLTKELALTDLDPAALVRLLKQFVESAETLEAGLAQLESLRGLVEDLMPLATGAVSSTTLRLDELERRGYFDFAREGWGVVDRVVTSYDENDIRALGDNIVLILDTVKEMTQPQVMTMLRNTMHSMEEADVESASLFSLLRQLRDPEVKRGLARLLGMLRSMGGPPVTNDAGNNSPTDKEET